MQEVLSLGSLLGELGGSSRGELDNMLGEGPLPFLVLFRLLSLYVGPFLAILRSCWLHLGSNLAILASTWPSWLHLGVILSHIRLRLGASWSILGVVGPLK